jgi:hypothetical protein
MNETGETEGNNAMETRAAAQLPPGAGRLERQPILNGAGSTAEGPSVDQSRFLAGLIGLYNKVLSEPAPERMLELIEEIRRNESKSK